MHQRAAAEAMPEAREQTVVEKPLRLQERRIAAVIDALHRAGARSVVDLGCGDGDLVVALARDASVERVAGSDVSVRELERAKERLDRALMPASRRERIGLFQSLRALPRRARRRVRRGRAAGSRRAPRARAPARASRAPCSARRARRRSCSRRPTASTTRASRRWRTASSAIADHRFEWTRAEFRGVGGRDRCRRTATPWRTATSATPTRRSARRPRWRCSRAADDPRLRARRADRRVGLGQVHVRRAPFPADRDPVVGPLPRARRRRRDRPERDQRRVRRAATRSPRSGSPRAASP